MTESRYSRLEHLLLLSERRDDGRSGMIPMVRGFYTRFDHVRLQIVRGFFVRVIDGHRTHLLVTVIALAAIVVVGSAWRARLDHDQDAVTSKQLQAALETSMTLIHALQPSATADLRRRAKRSVGTLNRQIRAIALAERAAASGELDQPKLMYRHRLSKWEGRIKPALRFYLSRRQSQGVSPDYLAFSPQHRVATPPEILRFLSSFGMSLAQAEFARRDHVDRMFDAVSVAVLFLLLIMVILLRRTSGAPEHASARTNNENVPSKNDQASRVNALHGQESAQPAAPLALLPTVLAGFAENPESQQAFLPLLHEVECLIDAKCSAIFIIKNSEHYNSPLVCTDPAERDCFVDLLRKKIPATRLNNQESIQTFADPKHPGIHIIAVLAERDGVKKGVLLVKRQFARPLSSAEKALLNSLGKHLAAIICSVQRAQVNRRAALCEERAVIARELHDSLAQSLSYLKIQTSRLQSLLHPNTGNQTLDYEDVDAVLQELRTNLNLAYRQLRELITTFRLTMNGRSLGLALKDSVEEFENRSSVAFTLDNRVPDGLLSVDEEMHVLQIVRECACNVVLHAQAKRADVSLDIDKAGLVHVRVDDDGVGMIAPRSHDQHHGFVIMQQRAHSLGGDMRVLRSPDGGTRVQVRFASHGANVSLEQARRFTHQA